MYVGPILTIPNGQRWSGILQGFVTSTDNLRPHQIIWAKGENQMSSTRCIEGLGSAKRSEKWILKYLEKRTRPWLLMWGWIHYLS